MTTDDIFPDPNYSATWPVLEKLKDWLEGFHSSKPVGAELSYVRGWHDCIQDVKRKLKELEEQ